MTVTVGVKCFNNVRYIREALESAFRQTYRPLEIVVCDDCSTDGSWETIREVVEAHRGEPGLRVVAELNERNLGNLGNWERICELATGDFVVKFDGDDVSEPDRVSRIVFAIESARAKGLSPTVVGHGGWMISPSGRPMGAMYPAARGNVVGAAMAFSRRCFTEFGHATCDPRIVDDELYACRGMMLGDFVEMNDRLVRYRCGTGVSNAILEVRRPMLRLALDWLAAVEQGERACGCARTGGGASRSCRGRYVACPALRRAADQDVRTRLVVPQVRVCPAAPARLAAPFRVRRRPLPAPSSVRPLRRKIQILLIL